MRKSKFLAFVSVISCIALLSSIALIPTPAAADTTEDLVLYSNDFQTSAGVTSNSYVNTALQYESSSIFKNGYNSTNQYLKVNSAKLNGTYIKAFTELPSNSFNCGDSLTQDDILVTKQTFRFNLAQSNRINESGAYAAVYCYWYKNDNSYQQIAIGKKTSPTETDPGTIGVWMQHDYEGYSKYYTAKNTPVPSTTRDTTYASSEIFTGSTINYTSATIDAWYTCTITFESATKVKITLQRDGDTTVYTDSFEDYTKAPSTWFFKDAEATTMVQNVRTANFTDGLVSEDLRKTKAIGFGVATNVANGSGNDAAMFDDVEVIMDAETYAAKLAEKQEAAQAEVNAAAFKTKHTEVLSLNATNFEALYNSNNSQFRLYAEKISAAVKEYEAASYAVKAKLTDEYSTLSILAEVAEKYAYAYGEAYFDDFNDKTCEDWVIIDKDATLARAQAIKSTADFKNVGWATVIDGTAAFRAAFINTTNAYENMSIRLITMFAPSLSENRGVYDLGTVSFDSQVYKTQTTKYIYWYQDQNNYKWFEVTSNGYWLIIKYGAVIEGCTVTSVSSDVSYDGTALVNAPTNFDDNGTVKTHVTLEYRADGAYVTVAFTKNNVNYKTKALNLDKSIKIKKSDTTYTSYAALEEAVPSLAGIGNSSSVSAAFGISGTTFDWGKPIDNFKMTYNLPFTLSMEEGAYLYTSSPYGIKFVCNVAANSYYRGANNIELLDAGILYIPTAALESGERLTYERTLVANSKNTKALAVSASIVDSATAPSSINGSLLNVADLMPNTAFTTRGYIRYRLTTDADGVYRVMYTDENSVSRSVLTTAQNACLADMAANSANWEGITADTVKAYTVTEALAALQDRSIIG